MDGLDKLRRSDDYYRKLCMSKEEIMPDQSEIRFRMGDPLTEAFFESCLPPLKPYLGLTPTLEGPPDDQWISPSDLLIGKVLLTPPLTSKHIQALTHQGILEIGRVVEEKFNNEHELNKKRALRDQEALLKYIAERDKKIAIAETIQEQQKICESAKDEMRKNFAETLLRELDVLEKSLQEEKEEAVEAAKKEMQEIMQMKLELAVHETTCRLIDEFAYALMKQSRRMHVHFWYHIKQEKKKLKEAVAREKSQCIEELGKLHSELQNENIANIMYILASERRKCACQKQALEQNFVAVVQKLEKELEEQTEKLQSTTFELEKRGQEVLARDNALFEIIKQFQKFIYFVLRAMPTQAEYLLNVEKLMVFEFAKAITDSRPEILGLGEEESSLKSEPLASLPSIEEEEEGEGLVVPDYHSCDNIARVIDSAHTLESNEDLPAFVFGEKLYVRQDFRNMISQGLRISKSNELWNFEVDDLMEDLEPSPSEERSVYAKNFKSFVSVRFSRQQENIPFIEEEEEKVIQSHEYEQSKQSSEETETPEPTEPVRVESTHISRFSATRDSLTIYTSKMRSRGSLTEKVKEKRSTSKDSKLRDSLIVGVKKSKESKISCAKDMMLKNRDSKLEFAVDSLLLLKSKENLKSIHSKGSVDDKSSQNAITYKKKNTVNIGVQCESKTVMISHVEIIPADNKTKTSSVNFHAEPKVIPDKDDVDESTEVDQGKRISLEGDTFSKKPECKVVGDLTSTVHEETQDEFTMSRVKSFVRIFREDPSLRRLFIEASKN